MTEVSDNIEAGKAHIERQYRVVTVTEASLARAFTEWERRYREEPERFQRETERMLRGDAKSYGDQAAPYLLSILDEQRGLQ